jgi:hypothetical protein
MPTLSKNLTKADVKFDGFRVSRVTTLDDTLKEVTKWYVDVGYKVKTTEGEEYVKDKQIELDGDNLKTAQDFLTTIYNQIKTEEGI